MAFFWGRQTYCLMVFIGERDGSIQLSHYLGTLRGICIYFTFIAEIPQKQHQKKKLESCLSLSLNITIGWPNF